MNDDSDDTRRNETDSEASSEELWAVVTENVEVLPLPDAGTADAYYVVAEAEPVSVTDEPIAPFLVDGVVVEAAADDSAIATEEEEDEDDEDDDEDPCSLLLPSSVKNDALYEAVSQEQWADARDLLRYDDASTRRLTEFTDRSNKWTPLHKACGVTAGFLPPPDVFRDLITATVGDERLAPDLWGDTALHLASKFAPDEVVTRLLERFPDSVTDTNKHGSLALHDAVNYQRSPAVIRSLLFGGKATAAASPRTLVTTLNNHDNSPLSLFLNHVAYSRSKNGDVRRGDNIYRGMSRYCVDQSKVQTREVMSLLLRAAHGHGADDRVYDGDDDDDGDNDRTSRCERDPQEFLLLHAALRAKAPPYLIGVVLDSAEIDCSHRGQLLRSDERGDWPVHIAVANTTESSSESGNNGSSEILNDLLSSPCARGDSANARSAACVPNREGRLPLALMAEANKNTCDLFRVFRECTFASGTRDVATHCFPFMLAAAANTSDARRCTTREHRDGYRDTALDGDGDGESCDSEVQDSVEQSDDQNENPRHVASEKNPPLPATKERLQRMTNSYMLLMENPAVLQYYV